MVETVVSCLFPSFSAFSLASNDDLFLFLPLLIYSFSIAFIPFYSCSSELLLDLVCSIQCYVRLSSLTRCLCSYSDSSIETIWCPTQSPEPPGSKNPLSVSLFPSPYDVNQTSHANSTLEFELHT